MPKLQFAEDYDISLSIHISGESAVEYPYSSPANANLLSEILEKGLLDHPITDTDSYVELNVDVYDDEYTNTYDDDRNFYGGNRLFEILVAAILQIKYSLKNEFFPARKARFSLS